MTTTIKNPSTPAYITFVNALIQECSRLGLPAPDSAPTVSGLPENVGYCFLQWSSTSGVAARLIIPKSVLKMGLLDSHIDLSAYKGFVPLKKNNGKVLCKFEPSIELLSPVLNLFVGASRRASQAPVSVPKNDSKPASQATPVIHSGSSDEDLARLGALAD